GRRADGGGRPPRPDTVAPGGRLRGSHQVSAIRYFSSRDDERAQGVDFETAMLRGLAPDGGLYLPERLPAVGEDWRGSAEPADLAAQLLPELTGLEREEIAAIFRDALDFDLPVVELSDGRYVLELFHGPTAALDRKS